MGTGTCATVGQAVGRSPILRRIKGNLPILIPIISSLYNGFNGDCLFLTKFLNGAFCLRTYCFFSIEPRHLCEIGPYLGYGKYTVINLRSRAKVTRFRSRFCARTKREYDERNPACRAHADGDGDDFSRGRQVWRHASWHGGRGTFGIAERYRHNVLRC